MGDDVESRAFYVIPGRNAPMEHDGIDMAYRKYAAWVIYGPAIKPELALEVILRTDVFFASGKSSSPYQRSVRRLLRAPQDEQYYGTAPDGARRLDANALVLALERYQNRMRWLLPPADGGRRRPLRLLTNAQIAHGSGWCYPDGTIALAEEVKRGYPTLIWDECEALAAAFPDLEFSIAYWGRSSDEPSAGFIVRDGYVAGTSGDDPELFGRYGKVDCMTVKGVAEQAARAAKARLSADSKFGSRTPDRPDGTPQPARGLPDDVLERWSLRMQASGQRGAHAR